MPVHQSDRTACPDTCNIPRCLSWQHCLSCSINGSSISIGEVNVSSATLITIAANVVIMVALTLFTSKTKTGKAMRCVSEDRGAAELMGINVNRTISLTFAIGSTLAAIAGVLLCSSYPVLLPTTGSMPGIKAFTAAV